MPRSNKSNKFGPEFSREREFKVILEDLQSQFRTFGEGLQIVREGLEDVREGLEDVREGLDDVRSRLGRLESDVTWIKSEMFTKSDFAPFFETLSGHETRFLRLEKTR